LFARTFSSTPRFSARAAAATPCPRARGDAKTSVTAGANMPRIFGAAGEARLKSSARRARKALPRRCERRDGFTF